MKNKENQPSKKKPLDNYIKYSTAGFQMLAAILIGYFLGSWLDKKFPLNDNGTPIFTAISCLIFAGIAMYLFIRQVTREDK
ncbi:hypothetical protein BH09BAC1_BH09BAC1_10060 [soil metagenome]